MTSFLWTEGIDSLYLRHLIFCSYWDIDQKSFCTCHWNCQDIHIGKSKKSIFTVPCQQRQWFLPIGVNSTAKNCVAFTTLPWPYHSANLPPMGKHFRYKTEWSCFVKKTRGNKFHKTVSLTKRQAKLCLTCIHTARMFTSGWVTMSGYWLKYSATVHIPTISKEAWIYSI